MKFTSQNPVLKNAHVSLSASEKGGNFVFEMTYKDHFENSQKIYFSAPARDVEADIARYGAPSKLFGSFSGLSESEYENLIKNREDALKMGLLCLDNNSIMPDYAAVVRSYYERYGKVLAKNIEKNLQNEGILNRVNAIQSALKFVQDIPYGIPNPAAEGEKTLAGIIPPPAILSSCFGECDSKMLLFCSLAKYFVPEKDIIFLLTPGHALSAVCVEENEAEEISYLTEDLRAKNPVSPVPVFAPLQYGERWFLPCETAGPARFYWGELPEKDSFEVREMI
jgi:hypothetical protein